MSIVSDAGFLAEVNRKAGLLRQKLEGLVGAHPDVFDSVRGSGLMLGLKCRAPNGDVVAAAYGQELLCVPAADNVIRLLPALNIRDDELGEAVARLDRAATAIAS
jgi:acetylornithine/N-succinyldiaminopimelate aminotransferase